MCRLFLASNKVVNLFLIFLLLILRMFVFLTLLLLWKYYREVVQNTAKKWLKKIIQNCSHFDKLKSWKKLLEKKEKNTNILAISS